MSARQRGLPAACRVFEDRLLAALVAERPAASLLLDPHAGGVSGCAECVALVTSLIANEQVLGQLETPCPSPEFLELLRKPPHEESLTNETRAILALLTPGALATPEPGADFLARLTRIPDGAVPAAQPELPAASSEGLAKVLPMRKRLFGDWRVTVALTYAAALLIAVVLGVDPLRAARGTAESLTSAGENAVETARSVASSRIAAATAATSKGPLTQRLDYRVYRAFAAGRARASAYSQVVFERVLGKAFVVESTTAAHEGAPEKTPEPKSPTLRS